MTADHYVVIKNCVGVQDDVITQNAPISNDGAGVNFTAVANDNIATNHGQRMNISIRANLSGLIDNCARGNADARAWSQGTQYPGNRKQSGFGFRDEQKGSVGIAGQFITNGQRCNDDF
jgi:hypothetical protein